MRERPILFSAPMIRAILSGVKTQTRRVVKGAPEDWAPVGPEWFAPTVIDRHGDEQPGADVFGAGEEDGERWIRCPYGAPGDRLWVRERLDHDAARGHFYTATGMYVGPMLDYEKEPPPAIGLPMRAIPSIHMPRWASRITLEVTGVRVERLQDISEADAQAEGCSLECMTPTGDDSGSAIWGPGGFRALWESINGAGSWDANPWIWCVEFRRIEP